MYSSWRISILALALVLGTVSVSAHRVIGRRYPTLATALVRSQCGHQRSSGPALGHRPQRRLCEGDEHFDGQRPHYCDWSRVARADERLRSGRPRERRRHVGRKRVAGTRLCGCDARRGGARPGGPRLPGTTPTRFCFSGPFDPAVPIETVLNGVFIAFQGDASLGNATDIGVWERRP